MRIKISKDSLLSSIQAVIGVVSSKNTLPILSNILLETDKDSLRLTATDLDIGMMTSAPAQILEEGAITVSAKRLIDIVKELPEQETEISTKKNNSVVIENKGVVFKILGIPKDEFPKLPALLEKDKILIKQNDLKRMLNLTMFAISHDETRFVLNGVCLVVLKNQIKTVATDGRRLAIAAHTNDADFKIEKKIIIPAKTAQELNRAIGDSGDVAITFSKNQAMFQVNNLYIISRLIEGEFPNYEQAIPKESNNKLRINRDSFISAVKRASLLTTPESQAIKLQLQKNKLTISKTTPEIGEAKEDIETDYEGDEFLIGFNPGYLLDVLKSVQKDGIEFELSGPEKPGVIRIGNDYVYIVLPMQVV